MVSGMKSSPFSVSAATPAELAYLHGKSVLVRSAQDRGVPRTAMRGTLEVHAGEQRPEVRISLDYPQMFTSPAHHRTLVLDDAAIERLLESEHEGTFDLTLEGPVDPHPSA